MRVLLSALLILPMLLFNTASQPVSADGQEVTVVMRLGSPETTVSSPANNEETKSEEEAAMPKLNVTINNQQFTAVLYDNAAAREWLKQLPAAYIMSELNGNEKYNYLNGNLPADASRPEGINAGDIMLYGSDCLVLFYESFDTSYSYTPLGYLTDTTGLAKAVGRGAVNVSFAVAE